MGWEVFERKALLLAAARDLEENGVKNDLKLAAADIFVEKAQRALTWRGWLLYGFGLITATAVVTLLSFAAWYVYAVDPRNLLHVHESTEWVSTAYLTVLLLKSTTAGGFVVGIAYFLVSLSRALLHEATVLFSRRHSLRFGRLFVYLKSEEMTRQDLEAVFNWTAEFSTAFKDIQPDQVTKSPLVRLIEQPGESAKVIADAVKPAFEKLVEDSRKDIRGAEARQARQPSS